MSAPLRMIVTHVNDDGSSGHKEVQVQEAAQNDPNGNPIFRGYLAFGTPKGDTQVGPGTDHDNVFEPFYPVTGGHRFTVFSFLPESWAKNVEPSAPAEAEADDANMEGLMDAFDPDRPGMHITDSIDYVYIISGEVGLELDEGEVTVKAGDIVVQRGTWHAWRNHTEVPCVVAAVLIGADRAK